ncbi:MAG: phosphatidylglycerol lysyltransferase [Spirochaetaceae bacterium]|jgi:phosphoglucomutase|nr:phosphatidylglycerol lysyltransferase [Spirochaetaceae bacterium]
MLFGMGGTGEEAALEAALNRMIFSPSGWRGVFAEHEESPSPAVGAAYRVIAAAAAAAFARCLKDRKDFHPPAPAVILGMDTRPTGRAAADAMIRGFIQSGCAVRFAGVTAAPEIMAYAREAGKTGNAQGFAYISASHNPIGYNGFKFGLVDGGVLDPEESAALTAGFRDFMAAPDRIARAEALLCRAKSPQALAAVYDASPLIKNEAYAAYLAFTQTVNLGGDAGPALARALKTAPLGIAVDFNGSARAASIDRAFFTGLGVRWHAINDTPGAIAHRILPEGASLDPCRSFLTEIHREHPEVVLGYVPDCDGDRGNAVIWDEERASARSLEAQEVFALACVGELAHLVWTGELSYNPDGTARTKAAVVANDPTSLRIDRIARAFGVSVFRAEVGEANVVSLARRLREQEGYIVRILGEGSAGGSITYPSLVRDPLSSVMALLKLLAIRTEGGAKGFFDWWRFLSGNKAACQKDFSLADLLKSLPPFVTTGSSAEEAALTVKSLDHAALKDRYQAVFLREWEAEKEGLKRRYGISGWSAASYQGTEEKRGITRFGAAGKGGLKITFTNNAGNQAAWIWMRGSRTEPVFRLMADAEGPDPGLERYLIAWQRRMVAEADA